MNSANITHHALTVLARLGTRREQSARLLTEALTRRVEDIAEMAIEVAMELGEVAGRALADRLRIEGSSELALKIMTCCNEPARRHSLPLREVAWWTTRRCLEALDHRWPDVDEDRADLEASLLNDLAVRALDIGQMEQAEAAVERAVRIRRWLVTCRGSHSTLQLAKSLHNLGSHLSEVGRHEEAVDATKEAIEIRRLANDDAAPSDLAENLLQYGGDLFELGRAEEALEAAQEAVSILQNLARQDEKQIANLAKALSTLGRDFASLGRHREALEPAYEAVRLRRQLAAERPDTFLSELAVSLNNYGIWQENAGQLEPALESLSESATLRRQLAAARPEVFTTELFINLANQGGLLVELNRPEESLPLTSEAVEGLEKICRHRPEFLPNLAIALNLLGSCHRALGRLEASLSSFRSAAKHYRSLAGKRPGRFGVHYGTVLHNTATVLADLHQDDEALAMQRASVEVLQRLADELPGDVPQLDLAMALTSLVARLRAVDERHEALAAGERAVSTYRRLEAEHPLVAGSQCARALVNLGAILSDLGREDEAIETTQEAVSIYRRLAKDLPCDEELATCQLNLSYDLAEHGRFEDALEAGRAAAAVCQQATGQRGRVLEPLLAASLANVGNRLAELDRWQEGLAVLRQSGTILESLNRRQPGRFDADLARTVAQQGILLGCLGRRREAEETARRGLEGLQRLASSEQAADGLEALATELALHDRHDEALDAVHAAIKIRRGEAAGEDVWQILDHLRVLQTAFDLAQDSGRPADVFLLREAVDHSRRLAAGGRREHQLLLAHNLHQLGLHLRELEQHSEALVPLGEAIAIYRDQCALLEGKKILPFVIALNGLARSHIELGQLTEAHLHAEQALDLVAPFFAQTPEDFRETTRLAARCYVQLCRRLDREPTAAGLVVVSRVLSRE